MDPNANLARQRQLRDEYRDLIDRIEDDSEGGDDDTDEQQRALLRDLVDLTEALDEWMSRGGFAPSGWRRS